MRHEMARKAVKEDKQKHASLSRVKGSANESIEVERRTEKGGMGIKGARPSPRDCLASHT